MLERSWFFGKAARLVQGPWKGEPDKIQWQDPDTGLPCLMVRGPVGAWCGYVGVPRSHPAYGVHYDAVGDVDAHGGLTFAGPCQENRDGVCHVPDPGEPDDVWWLGFDCAHVGDRCPSLRVTIGDEYRDMVWVREEVTDLARQLGAAPKGLRGWYYQVRRALACVVALVTRGR